jgi:hypothetical protein
MLGVVIVSEEERGTMQYMKEMLPDENHDERRI